MKKRHYKNYTTPEDEFITKWWGKKPTAWIAIRLGREPNAIRQQAGKIGLPPLEQKPKGRKNQSDDEAGPSGLIYRKTPRQNPKTLAGFTFLQYMALCAPR